MYPSMEKRRTDEPNRSRTLVAVAASSIPRL
jgi:hypothetical protein